MFTEFCIWAISIVDKLKSYLPSDNYMQSFAHPVDKSKLKDLDPATVLVDFSGLIECFHGCDSVTYTNDEKSILEIDKEKISRIFMKDDCQSFDLSHESSRANYYKVNNPHINDVYVKKNKKSLKIISEKLRKLKFHFEDETISFLDIINESGQMLINFSDIEYAYTENELFYDHQMERATQSFLSIFHPYADLMNTTSEKGKVDMNSVKFEDNSLFSFIENTFSNEDYLICDDLGHEVADYISVTENETVSFYHAKSDHTRKLSASAFHVVVSQALKNLGSIVNVEKMDLNNKRNIWGNFYGKTKINRLTTSVGGDISNAIEMLRTTAYASSSTKRVWLVVDFISKKDLVDQFDRGPNKRTVQIIWLLSSFVNDCREMGVQPRIACKP